MRREGEGSRTERRVFIGRHEERDDIKTRLQQDGGFLLLYGQPLVGKASLALQVAEELQNEQTGDAPPLHVCSVDCKDAADWHDIMRAMCRAFSFDEEAANENVLTDAMRRYGRQRGGGGAGRRMLLLLLRVHCLKPNSPDVTNMTRCLQNLAGSDVMTMVTSRRQLLLPVEQRVGPLTLNDAEQLLRHRARDVRAEEFREVLQQYCHGLPPLVLKVAEMASGGPLLALSAADLMETLARDPGLLMEGLSEEARTFFSSLSPKVQTQVRTLGQLLDGSFSVEALQAVLGTEGSRMRLELRILHAEAPLLIDDQSQRMRLEPLVLHHIRELGPVPASNPARLRVVTFLGRVLTQAEQQLYIEGQNTVYGCLHGDWPQLQCVLRQAIHCNVETYQAYMQVALKADKLLAKCFPNDALQFYQNMATAAEHFGTSCEQAVLQGLIGMAVTQGQGCGWAEALQHFHRALPVLQDYPRSVSYLRLLVDMGLAYFKLNQLHDADRYLTLAVAVSDAVEVEDDRELVFHLLRARNFLALPCIFRGHLSQSKALLLETLELCEQLAPHHPDKPILINSLGLVFERSGEDQNKALHYYTQSLVERRRYAVVAPGDLVATLNNVGMQYSQRGDYDRAMIFLKEAGDIRKREGKWNYYTALTEQHIGQVCIQRGDYRAAERHLEEAACVYARCTPSHDVRAKVALCLSHLYVTPALKDLSKTQKYLKEVCDISATVDLSDAGLVVLMTAVQHQIHLGGWTIDNNLRPLLSWVTKRISQFDGDRNKELGKHTSLFDDVVAALQQPDVSQDKREAVTSRGLQQCQICRYLSVQEDTRALWREVEKLKAKQRDGIGRLLRSDVMREVVRLSGQSRSASIPVQEKEREKSTNPVATAVMAQSLPCGRFAHSPSDPQVSLSGQEAVGRERGGGGEEEGDPSADQQLQRVLDRVLKQGKTPTDVQGEVRDSGGQTWTRRDRHCPQSHQKDVTWPAPPGTHTEDGKPALAEDMHQVIDRILTNLDQTRDAAELTRAVDTGQSVHVALSPARCSNLRDCDTRCARPSGPCDVGLMEGLFSSSCSFTSSETPSTSSGSDVVISSGSLGSTEDVGGLRQQEIPTMCQRDVEIPSLCERVVEISRLCESDTCERVVEIHPVQETAGSENRASVAACGHQHTAGGNSVEGGVRGVDVRSVDMSGVDVRGVDVPGPATHGAFPAASSSSSDPSHHVDAGADQLTTFSPPQSRLDSDLQPYATPATLQQPPLLRQPFVTSPRPAGLQPPLTSEGVVTSPQQMLKDVGRCSRQLIAVLPSTATSDQRLMLEKIAALSTTTLAQHQHPQKHQHHHQQHHQHHQHQQHQHHQHQHHQQQHQHYQHQPGIQNPNPRGAQPFVSASARNQFQNLHPSPRGARPFTHIPQQAAEPAGDPAATVRDQFEAWVKLSAEGQHCVAGQSQRPATTDGGTTQLPRATGHAQSGQTAGVDTVQARDRQGAGVTVSCSPPVDQSALHTDSRVVSSSVHADHSLSGGRQVHPVRAFPEVQQRSSTFLPSSGQGQPSAREASSSRGQGSSSTSELIPTAHTARSARTAAHSTMDSSIMAKGTVSSAAVPLDGATVLERTMPGAQRPPGPGLSVSGALPAAELAAGPRQPTESDESSGSLPPGYLTEAALHGRQVAALPLGQRQPTENDERQDNPRHVCSLNCHCSWAHTS